MARSDSELTNLSNILGSRPVSEISSRPFSTVVTSRPVSEVIGIQRPVSESLWSASVSEVIHMRPQSLNGQPNTAVVAAVQRESDYAESLPNSKESSRSGSIMSDEPPEIPRRPSPTLLEAFKKEHEHIYENDKNEMSITPPSDDGQSSTEEITANLSENESDDSMADIENIESAPLYQEVDQNHESTYEPKKSIPPQIKIERKIFHEARLLDSLISSSNGSEEIIHQNKMKVSGESGIISTEEFSSGPGGEEDVFTPIQLTPLTLTPKSPPLTPFLPEGHTVYNHSSNSVSAIATLPRTKGKDRQLKIMYSRGHVADFLSQDDKPPPVLEPQVIGPSGERLLGNHSPVISGKTHWVSVSLVHVNMNEWIGCLTSHSTIFYLLKFFLIMT